eukprot:m51a1_g8188 hypothetical protein (1250) ;mRNA; r:162535-166832
MSANPVEASLEEGRSDAVLRTYRALAEQLKSDDGHPSAQVARALTHPSLLGRLCACCCRDASSQAAPEDLRQAALRVLGYACHNPSIACALPASVASAIAPALHTAIDTARSKSTCNMAVWVVSVQNLPPATLTASHDVSTSVAKVLAEPRFASPTLEAEALTALSRLLTGTGSPAVSPEDTADVWAPVLYRRLVGDNAKVRDRAAVVVGQLLESWSGRAPRKLAQMLHAELADAPELLRRLDALLGDAATAVEGLRAWGLLLGLLGPELLRGGLINKLLSRIERPLVSPDTPVRVAAFEAWEFLVNVFASDKATFLSHKRISLLLKPLTVCMESPGADVEVLLRCAATWRAIANSVPEESALQGFGVVVRPALQILLSRQSVPDTVATQCYEYAGRALHCPTSSADSQGPPPVPSIEKPPRSLPKKVDLKWAEEHSAFLCSVVLKGLKYAPRAPRPDGILECVSSLFCGLVVRLSSLLVDGSGAGESATEAAALSEASKPVFRLLLSAVAGLTGDASDFACKMRQTVSRMADCVFQHVPQHILAGPACAFKIDGDGEVERTACAHLVLSWSSSLALFAASPPAIFCGPLGKMVKCFLSSGELLPQAGLVLQRLLESLEASPSSKPLYGICYEMWCAVVAEIIVGAEQSAVLEVIRPAASQPTGAPLALSFPLRVAARAGRDEAALPAQRVPDTLCKLLCAVSQWAQLKVGKASRYSSLLCAELAQADTPAGLVLAGNALGDIASAVDWSPAEETASVASRKRARPDDAWTAGASGCLSSEQRAVLEAAGCVLLRLHTELSSAAAPLDLYASAARAIAAVATSLTAIRSAAVLCAATALHVAEPMSVWVAAPKPCEDAPASADDAVARVKQAAFSLWDAFCSCARGCGGPYDSAALTALEGALRAGLSSKHRKVKGSAVELWNATFGAARERLAYPRELAAVLAQLRDKVALRLPFFEDAAPADRDRDPSSVLYEEATAVDDVLIAEPPLKRPAAVIPAALKESAAPRAAPPSPTPAKSASGRKQPARRAEPSQYVAVDGTTQPQQVDADDGRDSEIAEPGAEQQRMAAAPSDQPSSHTIVSARAPSPIISVVAAAPAPAAECEAVHEEARVVEPALGVTASGRANAIDVPARLMSLETQPAADREQTTQLTVPAAGDTEVQRADDTLGPSGSTNAAGVGAACKAYAEAAKTLVDAVLRERLREDAGQAEDEAAVMQALAESACVTKLLTDRLVAARTERLRKLSGLHL